MNYASWVRRVGASLVDGAAVSVPVIAGASVQGATMQGASPSGAGAVAYWIGLLISLGLWVFNRLIRQGGTGQSWGKSVLGLRLVGEETGRPVGAGMAFVRELAHVIDQVLCMVGYLFPLWDTRRQTIADKLLKTVVVR
ncbi:hypothetical protein GCM10010124_29800 [Pilimelia terevasa]|uniref:RDD domain-containing protein n=1 Tax=Pilimelia terevasa TaxID=53372 RepID=A0A8J3BSF1_9ACTN|nr:RDD family protein [Pilimelia terevasa]GGK35155.1 hypothetical protein GCM10010124_29800 [Pilimelia terevasa]